MAANQGCTLALENALKHQATHGRRKHRTSVPDGKAFYLIRKIIDVDLTFSLFTL